MTGVVREAEIFVAVLGASNLTYAEATWTQGLPDWIGAHVRMFRFWGARPRLLVPDNLKKRGAQGLVLRSGDQSQLRRHGGPLWCRHSAGTAVSPEGQSQSRGWSAHRSVLHPGPIAQPEVLLAAECNAAISEILVQLNGRVMRRLGVSRRELFETVERPAMQPLPQTDHEYAEWALARVGIDYHVEVGRVLLLRSAHA